MDNTQEVAVGDEVAWPLLFTPVAAWPELASWPDAAFSTLEWNPVRTGFVARDGRLSATWRADEPPAGDEKGLLTHAWVSSTISPPARGTITEVRVLSIGFERVEAGAPVMRRVPGTARLHSVERSPRRFKRDPEKGHRYRQEDGVLVSLTAGG